jgi:hypothetical protein
VLTAEIEFYKGTTDKYSISVWAEKNGQVISKKTKVHLKNKNSFYKLSLPVQIEPNCKGNIEEGLAQLVVEGLGAHAEKEFTLAGVNENLCQGAKAEEKQESKEPKKEKNSFQIIDLPAQISPGEAFRVKVQALHNKDAEFEAWSYLYRGNKCYSFASGERDGNKVSFMVDGNDEKTVKMLVKADQELEEGEYNLAMKYQKEGQKTVKSLTQKIYVKTSSEEQKMTNQTMDLLSSPEEPVSMFVSEKIPKKEMPKYSGIIVYESNSERSKNMIPYVLLVTFGLLSLALIIKRR